MMEQETMSEMTGMAKRRGNNKMNLSSSLVLIMLVIVIYTILLKVFAALLRITGLTKEKAGFQAISLFTNCGFTTAESEVITSNHVRRQIARIGMVTGNFFSVIIVSLLINVFLSLNTAEVTANLQVVLICFCILLVILVILRLPKSRTALDSLFESIAMKIYQKNTGDNIITLLDNYGRDAIAEVCIRRMPELLEGKSLAESELKNRYKLNFLMLKRKGKVKEITRDTIFQKDDVVVVFGNILNIKDLFEMKTDRIRELLDQEAKNEQNSLDLIENYGADVLAEVKVNWIPEELYCKTLAESGIKKKYKLNIMMIKRNDMPVMVGPDSKLEKWDSVILFGPYAEMKKLFSC